MAGSWRRYASKLGQVVGIAETEVLLSRELITGQESGEFGGPRGTARVYEQGGEVDVGQFSRRDADPLSVGEVMKGQDFFCSCPFGHHGGWVAVEGESAEAVRASLPPVFGSHAQVHEVEAVRF